MTERIEIAEDDPGREDVHALLEVHLEAAASYSPPESVHALDVDALRAPEVTFWTARAAGGDLLACAALKEIDPAHGEIKSMHTDARHRGNGVAARLVEHIIAEARRRGYGRLSLETGTPEPFAPARRLYARHGFEECGPFVGYTTDSYSFFMTLDLSAKTDG